MNPMKNIVTVLILCFSFIFANAQIQRTFLGNTLGVTTWNNAKSTLSQKGLEIIDCNQQAGTILVGNVTFSSYPCEFATLYFHNGLFYKIFFFIKCAELESDILPVYNNFKKKLKNKYSSYITSDDDGSIMFEDKVSFIYLGHSYSNNLYDTGLIYADKKIDNQRKQADNNEL